MRTLVISLKDLTGEQHGTPAAGTAVTVGARYSREVVLTDGTIIPPVIKRAAVAGDGVASFEVYESDSPEVDPDYQGFAIVVEATVSHGHYKGGTFRRTVQVTTASADPVPLGSLSSTQGVPAQWTSIEALMGELTTTVAAEVNDPNSAAHQAVGSAATDVVEGELADPQSPSRQSINDAASATAETVLTTELADTNSPSYQAVVDAAATTTDPAIAANISNPATLTAQALRDTLPQVKVSDHATLDAAIAATTAGGTVLIDADVTQDGQWNITKPVTLRGDKGRILKGATAVAGNWLSVSANDVHFDDVTVLDTGGAVTGNLINFNSGTVGGRVRGGLYTAPAARTFRVVNSTSFTFDDVDVDGCATALRLEGATTRARIRGGSIRNWADRGVEVMNSAAGAVQDLVIEGMSITDLTPGGSVRYPIHFSVAAGASLHRRVRVVNNIVIGPGNSYTDPAANGTADQIALFGCVNAVVANNVSIGGGDMGITIDGACDQVTITGNTVAEADTAGLAVWANSTNITVSGNTFMNNGQNRMGDRLAAGRAGIRGIDAAQVQIGANIIGDTQTVPTQQYGVSLLNCQRVSIATKFDGQGNVLGGLLDESGNTGVTSAVYGPGGSVALTAGATYTGATLNVSREGTLTVMDARFSLGTGWASGDILASLPAGFRPASVRYASAGDSSGGTCQVQVSTSGDIRIFSSAPPTTPVQFALTFPFA